MYRSTIQNGFFFQIKVHVFEVKIYPHCSTENDNNKSKKQYQLSEYMVESSVLQYKKCDVK